VVILKAIGLEAWMIERVVSKHFSIWKKKNFNLQFQKSIDLTIFTCEAQYITATSCACPTVKKIVESATHVKRGGDKSIS
jgi:hypothetical protein